MKMAPSSNRATESSHQPVVARCEFGWLISHIMHSVDAQRHCWVLYRRERRDGTEDCQRFAIYQLKPVNYRAIRARCGRHGRLSKVYFSINLQYMPTMLGLSEWK